MSNSIGELALKMTLDAQQVAEGLKLNRDEMKLHRLAAMAAMESVDKFALAEQHLQSLIAKNPAQV
jgi:hypothetical protein